MLQLICICPTQIMKTRLKAALLYPVIVVHRWMTEGIAIAEHISLKS